MRVLFICKKNDCYGFHTYTRRSSGLFNSTRFIAWALRLKGIDAHIVEVVDNNDIDRECARFNPDLVVIEALWVVPEKFPILMELHPKVKWFVHLHSEMSFLSLEGIAMEWIVNYEKVGVGLIANSVNSFDALSVIVDNVTYIPNVYVGKYPKNKMEKREFRVEIGCFGAIRPLKNQLIQALAAIKFAREIDKFLVFHINGSRVETGGEPVLKNIEHLFAVTPGAILAESKWNEPEEFQELLSHMDIGMQVSLTETFNVVSANYVDAGIPIVVSKEVKWASDLCKASDESIDDIVRIMHRVYRNKCLVRRNRKLLKNHSAIAQKMWVEFCEGQQ